MSNFKDKSSNEILMEMKQLEADHEALKNKMALDLDKLLLIEKTHAEGESLILKRLKGEGK